MEAAEQANGKSDRVEGILMRRVNAASVDAVLAALDISVHPKAPIEKRVEVLSKHFAKSDDLSECDVCGGFSDPDLPACPFCNDGEEGVPQGLEAKLAAEDDEEPPASSQDEVPPVPEQSSSGDLEAQAAEEESESDPKTAVRERRRVRKPVQKAPPPAAHATPKEKASTALAKVNGATTVQTVKTLDKAVAELRAAIQDARVSAYHLGLRLYAVFHADLWKLRPGEKSTVKYKTWDQFLEAEVPEITTRYAYQLMKVSQAYAEKEVNEVGVTKLYITLQVDEKEVQARLLEQAKGGASKSDLIREARASKPAKASSGKDHSRTQRQKTGTKAGKGESKITVVALLGKHTSKAYANGSEDKEARRLADQPWGYIDMVNDVRVFVSLVETPKGLRFKWDIRRVED